MDEPFDNNMDVSDEENLDAAELEAHLYSKIYYSNDNDDKIDQETTVQLYLDKSQEETNFEDSGHEPIISPPHSAKQDDDVIIIDFNEEESPVGSSTALSPTLETSKSDNKQNRSSKNISPNPEMSNYAKESVVKSQVDSVTPGPSTNKNEQVVSSNVSKSIAEKHRQKRPADAITNPVPSKKSRSQIVQDLIFGAKKKHSSGKVLVNPFYDANGDLVNESSSSESDHSVIDLMSTSSDDVEMSKYTDAKVKSKSFAEKVIQSVTDSVIDNEVETRELEDVDDVSSSEDEGIKILGVIDIAKERSLRAPLVDLIESEHDDKSEDSELELSNNLKLINRAKNNKEKIPAAASTPLSREEARSGKVVIEVEKSKIAPRQKHFVALRHSSDSDTSSVSSSDFQGPIAAPSLNLNLSGGRFGRTERLSGITFQDVTGTDPKAQPASKHRYDSWTPEMRRFYDDVDPEMADVTEASILATVPLDANWSTGPSNRNLSPGNRPNKRYFTSPRFTTCSICQKTGHQSRDCWKKEARCYMCGSDDHNKSYCPEMMCLRCGQPGMPYTSSCLSCKTRLNRDCFHCGASGHIAKECPDHWRRFHMTTETGPILEPNEGAVNYSNVWCPNCARKGHLVHQCRAFSAGLYPKSVLSVVSYEDANQQSAINSQVPGSETEPAPKERGAWRRQKRIELKEKKRAFKSFPHTPTHENKQSYFQSEHSSPHFNPSVLNVEDSLKKVKQKLINLVEDELDIPVSKKSRKKQKFEEFRMKKKKNHQPQPFPRGSPNNSFGGKSSRKEKLFQSLGIDRNNKKLNKTFSGIGSVKNFRETPTKNRLSEGEPGFNRQKRNFERLQKMRGGKKRKLKEAEDGYNFIKI